MVKAWLILLAVTTALVSACPESESSSGDAADAGQTDAATSADATTGADATTSADAGQRDVTAGVDASVSFSCADPHPSWVMCEDFEDGAGDIATWYEQSDFNMNYGVDDPGRMTLVGDVVHGGSYAVHMPAAASSGYQGATLGWRKCAGAQESPCADQGGGVRMDSFEELYFRTWVRFAEDHRYVHHFLNISGSTPDRYWSLGSSGCQRTGELGMGATVDFEPDNHQTFFYTYYPGMPCSDNCINYMDADDLAAQCDHCDDIGMPTCVDGPLCCWGDEFYPDSPNPLPVGEWFCFEMRLRANTPDLADGVMAYWVNDVLIHSVDTMRWRTIPELALNRASLQHYITSGDADGHSNRVWFDDVVVSTERIGCGEP